MKQFTSPTQITGQLGEDIAEMFLVKHGFTIVERNYTKKMGEIDLVASKDNKIHFVEVKSLNTQYSNVSHESYNPFENISRSKMRKFSRMCQYYLLERRVPRETLWEMDAIAVFLVKQEGVAQVQALWNIIM